MRIYQGSLDAFLHGALSEAKGFRTLQLTHALVRMGLAHNQRDLEMCSRWGETYWQVLLAAKTDGYPFIG